jgi:hypothetical protein
MTDFADLEQKLTNLLAERAASASPPSDAWVRIVTELSDGPTGWTALAVDPPDITEPLDASLDSGERTRAKGHGDDLTFDHLIPREESPARVEQKRWIGALVAVAATVLVVVGAVIAADRDDSDVVTAPVPPAATPDDTSSATAPGAALPQSLWPGLCGGRICGVRRRQ